ncbi:MAG: asparagine synthetase B, partial [Poseidonibacter sp.]
MCGIVGIVDFTKNIGESELDLMRDKISYRGPDSADSKLYFKNDYSIGLAHRRLSIQDLTSLGNQPMTFDNLTIIFNGEVYNFEEIKEELESYNYTFNSHSDTEVILKAFHKWDIKCIEKFRGMF